MGKMLEAIRMILPEALVHALRRWFTYRRFRPCVKEMVVDGRPLSFLIGDPTGEAWYAGYGRELSPEMAFTKGMVRPGEIILEVGAHHGMFTVLLARWTGEGGKVLAMEALPHNVRILERNVELNHLTNVTVINQAAGAEEGCAYLRGGSNSQVAGNLWGAACRVAMVKLDRFLSLGPTLVKIDVEGYEVEVLKGATALLASKPNLAIEVHCEDLRRRRSSLAEVLGFIDRNTYEIWLQPDGLTPPSVYVGGQVEPRPQIHLYALRKKRD